MTHVNHAAQAHTSDAARWKLTEFLRNAAVRGPRAGKFEAAGGSGVEDVATEIRGLAAASAQADAQESRWAKETVARINEAIGDIAVATQATRPSEIGRLREGGGVRYEKTWVGSAIVTADLVSANFPAGEEREIAYEVTDPGEPAGLFMDFGGVGLNLAGPTESFVIEVTGPIGTRQLIFASGTALSEMIDAINSFATETGARAVISGVTGVILHSSEHGADEFVSVRVLDDGGIEEGAGIFHLDPQDFFQVIGDPIAFGDATSPIMDADGRDMELAFNGGTIRGSSRDKLRFTSSEYTLDVRVKPTWWAGVTGSMLIRSVGDVGALGSSPYPFASGVDYDFAHAPEFASASLQGATFSAGETRDISFNLEWPASPGGFLMQFGGDDVDLGSAAEVFEIEIGGPKGARTFTFASGTSISTVAATINAFSDATGVDSFTSGSGVVVRTPGFGSTEFVSVRVPDDGNIEAGAGIKRLDANNHHAASGPSIAWNALQYGRRDYGGNASFTWRGRQYTGSGLNLQFLGPDYTVQLTLDPEQQRVGLIHAATISATAAARRGKG